MTIGRIDFGSEQEYTEQKIDREKHMNKRSKRILLTAGLVLLLSGIACGVYFGTYSHAAPEAAALLQSSGRVEMKIVDGGWLLDGPGTGNALLFYPGGKVEATAYLPLLTTLAQDGVDCFLLKMPLNLAIFKIDAAAPIQDAYAYDHWYVGGHSLGGVCAAMYAAKNADRLSGLILLAAYSTKPLDRRLSVLELHGSEDRVLDMEKLEAAKKNLPASALSEELPGGNHAQFGDYGPQKGDGVATVTREEQTRWTAEQIEGLIGIH